MSRKTSFRLLLLLNASLLVGWSLATAPKVEANACSKCSDSCRQEYRKCNLFGFPDCDERLDSCLAGCPCPP